MSYKPDELDKLGGDWAGYGESDVVSLAQQGKLTVVFADKGLLVNVQNAAGQWGTYLLKHTDVADF